MALVGREETDCSGSPGEGEVGGSCPGQQSLLLESSHVQEGISNLSR